MKKMLFILLSIQMLFALNVKELKKGDSIEDSIQHLEKKYYKVNINVDKDIEVKLTNLTADIDLYVKARIWWLPNLPNKPVTIKDSLPTIRKNDCYSSNSHTENEECRFGLDSVAPDQKARDVYIMVYGYQAASYKLEVSEKELEKTDTLTNQTRKGSVKKGESKQYRVTGKPGDTINVSLFDLNADADLRVKIGRKANKHTFDCKSTNGGTKVDSCSVTLGEDEWAAYVQVDGYRSANYSIKSTTKNPLIDLAKEHCLNKNDNTDFLLCKGNNVFIIDSKVENNLSTPYHAEYSFYKVNISTGHETVYLIESDEDSGEAASNGRFFFQKPPLNSKNLFIVDRRYPMVDDNGFVSVVNLSGKTLLEFPYVEYGSRYHSIKITNDDKKLTVIHEVPNGKKERITYDVSNPNEAKLISTEEL